MARISRLAQVLAVVTLSFLCSAVPAMAADALADPVESLLVFNNASSAAMPGLEAQEEYSLALAGEETPYFPTSAQPQKAPPLPLHTIEGVGGALFVPTAYLVNPGPEGTVAGMPAVSMTYLNTLKGKDLLSVAVTRTFWRKLEVGYALTRLYLGNLPHAIIKSGGPSTSKGDLLLHHFNARGLILEENRFGDWCPAVVAGIQIKYNSDMQGLDSDLAGLPTMMGFEKENGVDYVLTISKTIPAETFGLPPILLTAGVRNSQASNMGLTGFGEDRSTTFECDIAVLLSENLAVGYEFRQKEEPYRVATPFQREEDLHAVRCAWIINDRLTLAGGLAYIGNLANTDVPFAFGLQLKYEF